MSKALSRIALAITVLLATLWWAGGPVLPVRAANIVTVSSCDQTGLMSAISSAGSGDIVQFSGDCIITLSGTPTLNQNLTIDGSGHSVTISGGNSVQVFV